jgi:uracil-DNA glycosylase family 4
MKDRISKIINNANEYLNSLNRFRKSAIYVDEHGKISKTEIIREKNVPEKTNITSRQKKSEIEEDLFGNITVKREEWEFSASIDELNHMICNCMKCELGNTRTNFVFGVGNPCADIVLIGEAPGADEDAQGEPFVGRAGQLLNKILEASGFKREEVFICNILKCRPPGNRNPMPDEIEKCRPYLEKQLKLINPKLILLLGRVAAESLLKTKEPLAKLRGKLHDYKGYKVMVTFHPAALLRNPNWKRPTWEDMKQFKAIYGELIGKE